MNLCLAGGTFAADEVEREVSAEIVGEVLRMVDVIEQPCLIPLLFLLRVDTDIVPASYTPLTLPTIRPE